MTPRFSLTSATVLFLLAAIPCAATGGAKPDAWAINKQGVRLFDTGKFRDSIPVFEQALAIAAKTPNFDEKRLCRIHENLGRAYFWAGEAKEGVPHLEFAISDPSYFRAMSSVDKATVQTQLAAGYNMLGRFDEAAEALESARPELEHRYGPDSAEVSWVLAELGYSYHRLGRFSESARLYNQSLAIYSGKQREKDAAAVVERMANMYWSSGYYERAEELFNRAIQITEQSQGPDSPALVALLTSLGGVYRSQGQNWRRDAIYDRVDGICQKHPDASDICQAGGPKRPIVQAWLESDKGNYARAIPLFREQLENLQNADLSNVGTWNEFFISAMSLSSFYERSGDYDKAADVRLRLIRAYERYPKREGITYEKFKLARDYDHAKQTAKASEVYSEVLPLLEKQVEHDESGSSRLQYPGVLVRELADYYASHGQMQKAVTDLGRMLTQAQEVYGPDSTGYANSLTDVASFYFEHGPRSKAVPLLESALQILEKRSGPDSPDVGRVLFSLTVYAMEAQDLKKARDLLQRTLANNETNLGLVLSHGSEDDRRAALQSYSTSLDLAISLQEAVGLQDVTIIESTLVEVLQRKGRQLESSAEAFRALRQRVSDKDRQLLDELSEVRAMRASLILHRPPSDQAAYTQTLYKLRLRQDELESDAAQQVAGYQPLTQPIRLEQLRARIPPKAALVEMTVYRPFDGPTHSLSPPSMMAYVLRREGAVLAFDLGPLANIAAEVRNLRAALRTPSSSNFGAAARQLEATVLDPLKPALSGVTELVLSPDGDLNLIPFAVLLDRDNRYLFERYTIYYVTAGRDLVRPPSSPSARAAAIFADPAFGSVAEMAQSPAPRPAGPRSGDLMFAFAPLPGTLTEAEAIRRLMPTSEMFLRERATETALKQLHSPRILHIATHGFFLPNSASTLLEFSAGGNALSDESPKGQPLFDSEDPLLRSGLALACANQPCGGPDDGILTALEATTLDLQGTQLVVLSACDTGLGEVVNGDGIYGLRRAFLIAGAEHQMISLWKLDDAATSEFMAGFYGEISAGTSSQEALRSMQRKWSEAGQHTHPFYWAGFVISGYQLKE